MLVEKRGTLQIAVYQFIIYFLIIRSWI